MLPKEDSDLVKKCMEYEVEGPRPNRTRDRWKRTVKCHVHKLNKEDAIDRSRWRRLIKDSDN